MSIRTHRWCLLTIAVLGSLSSAFAAHAQDWYGGFQFDEWRVAGQSLNNSRNQHAEFTINAANVHNLATKWVFTTGGDVSATPTVAGDAVYFPDWYGTLFAVRKDNVHLIWSHKISDYDGIPGAMSRVSPGFFLVRQPFSRRPNFPPVFLRERIFSINFSGISQ